MSNLAELKGRMTEAVGRLSDAETDRRRSNEALARLLGDLEEKYRARNEELLYCARRIDSLSTENRELGDLLERLLGVVEGAFARGTDDPVYQASAMASELIAGWRDDAAAHDSHAAAPERVEPARFEPGCFEDVSDAELAAELADELMDGRDVGDLPPPLIEASAIHHAMSFPGGLVSAPDLPVPPGPGAVEDVILVEDDPQLADEGGRVEDDVILLDDAEDGDPYDVGGHALDAALGLEERDPLADDGPGVDIEIPEIDLADEPAAAGAGPDEGRDPEASIRAMMERLERVEERARAHESEEGGR